MKPKKDDFEEFWPSWKICKFFHITRSALYKWRHRGCPGGKAGYPIFEVYWWHQQNIVGDPGIETSLAEERLLRERAKREFEQVRAEKARGSVVDRGEAVTWVALAVSEARGRFWGLPHRLCGELAPLTDEKEIFLRLRAEIRSILNELTVSKKRGEKHGKEKSSDSR